MCIRDSLCLQLCGTARACSAHTGSPDAFAGVCKGLAPWTTPSWVSCRCAATAALCSCPRPTWQ
eukprot:1440257-Alexandrium_andersonii.AAC.1